MKSKVFGSLEQRVMDVLWGVDTPLTPNQVSSKIEGCYAYSTIVTILTRLHKKGLLRRRKKGKAYFYSVSESKEIYASSSLNDLYQGLFKSYGDIAITQFLDTLEDRPEDLDLLKKYLKSKK